MVDLLALRLEQAVAILKDRNMDYEVHRSEPRYRRHEEAVGEPIEYVVRQQLLTTNKVVLITVIKYRKEVL